MSRQFYDTPEQQAIKLAEENLKLKSELAQAKETNSRLQHRNSELELQVAQVRSRVQSDYRILSESHHELREQLEQAKCARDELVRQLHEAKAENDRLQSLLPSRETSATKSP